jgi:hypothetical protein
MFSLRQTQETNALLCMVLLLQHIILGCRPKGHEQITTKERMSNTTENATKNLLSQISTVCLIYAVSHSFFLLEREGWVRGCFGTINTVTAGYDNSWEHIFYPGQSTLYCSLNQSLGQRFVIFT